MLKGNRYTISDRMGGFEAAGNEPKPNSMDLVILTKASRHAKAKLRYALRSAKNLPADRVIICGPDELGADVVHLVPPSSKEREVFAFLSRLEALSEQFMVMPDCCVLQAPFVPQRYVNTGMMRRDEGAQLIMANTLRYLLHHEKPTFDYELDLPLVFSKSKLREVLESAGDADDFFVRTLYFNCVGGPHVRIGNPLIEQWSHYDDPSSVVIALTDLAHEHKQCGRWLAGRLPERSPFEPGEGS